MSIAYQPFGGARELMHCRGPAVLMSGPSGTGKSTAVLTKLHLVAEKYPGCRILAVRKTRASMSESVLVTFEGKVVPEGHPCLRGPHRLHRTAYTYSNGSTIVVGGMDNADRIMSTDYDLVAMFEATECTEQDFEQLTTRLRHGVVPYQQIVCDCNPSYPTHWLKQRADAGQMEHLESRHEDNPLLYDHVAKTWTPEGERYLAQLDGLTGARKQRLRHGRWVQAEGAIYESFSSVMVRHRETPSRGWETVVAGVDWGHTNPSAIVVVGRDDTARLHVLDEWAESKKLEPEVTDVARRKRDLHGVQRFLVDPSAPALREAMSRAALRAMPADNDVLGGIMRVQKYLSIDGAGDPRLTIEPHCTRLVSELESYEWDDRREDMPKKINDHLADALRYAIAALDKRRVRKVTHRPPKDPEPEGEKARRWPMFRRPKTLDRIYDRSPGNGWEQV